MKTITTIKADKKKINTPASSNSSILEALIDHEGYEREPYEDTKKYLTGGIGHKFTQDDFDNFNYDWSDKEKDAYWTQKFDEDYLTASRSANRIMEERGIEPNDAIREVLVDMVFNMGEKGVNKFPSFLKALADKDPERAVFEMKTGKDGKTKSEWYQQTGRRVDNLAKRVEDNLL
jgi:GH24 family phage-related lysozyme (muramidase)